MKSIVSIALVTIMLFSVLTGCGNRNKDEVNPTNPPATAAPTTAPATPAATAPNGSNTVNDGTMNDNIMTDGADRVENGANDVINGVENAVDDILGDDGVVNGDLNDGRIEEDTAIQPRNDLSRTR